MSQFTRFKQNYKASLTFFILGAVKVNSMILINISPSLAQTQQKLKPDSETLPTEIDLFFKKIVFPVFVSLFLESRT